MNHIAAKNVRMAFVSIRMHANVIQAIQLEMKANHIFAIPSVQKLKITMVASMALVPHQILVHVTKVSSLKLEVIIHACRYHTQPNHKSIGNLFFDVFLAKD